MVIVRLPSQWQPSKVLAVVMLTSCWRKPMSIWPNALVNAQKKKWVLSTKMHMSHPFTYTHTHSLTVFRLLLSVSSVLGWQNCHHHFKSTPVQNPKLVLEQTKGHHWWQIPAIDLIQFGLEIAWRFGTFEENPCPSWYASLLGSSCAWSTHKNDWPPWTYRWCVEKEVNINVKQPPISYCIQSCCAASNHCFAATLLLQTPEHMRFCFICFLASI